MKLKCDGCGFVINLKDANEYNDGLRKKSLYCKECIKDKKIRSKKKESKNHEKKCKKENEIVYTCDYCDEEFEFESMAKIHEKKCGSMKSKNIKKIFVNRGRRFLGGGIGVLLLSSGMDLFLKSLGFQGLGVMRNILIYGGIFLIFLALIMFISGEKEVKWMCSVCGKSFFKKKDCLGHMSDCESK